MPDLSYYLDDISKTPLLTPDDEIRLGGYVRTTDRRDREGDAACALYACDRLVRSNLRFVVKFVRRFVTQHLPLEDLIAEGNVGLMRAAELFDPKKKVRFSTYASWWIHHSVREMRIKSNFIRIPAYMAETAARCRRVMGKTGKTAEAAVRDSGIKRHKRHDLLRIVKNKFNMAPDGPGTRDWIAETYDTRAADPVDAAAVRDEEEYVERLLRVLSKQAADIIRRRFGLGGMSEETLTELGEAYHLTRERIRQIEAEALNKLRVLLGEPVKQTPRIKRRLVRKD